MYNNNSKHKPTKSCVKLGGNKMLALHECHQMLLSFATKLMTTTKNRIKTIINCLNIIILAYEWILYV